MSQGATPDGTERYAQKFKEIAAEGHFRKAQGLTVSSLGVGTYLGQPTDSTDGSYAAALVEARLAGFNVFDTAINYRFQRSERNVGTGLKVLANKGLARDEFVVCTKGGYLTPDGAMPADANRYFFDEYIQRGVFTAKEVAAGCHCMATRFLENQLNRSLKNLGASCIDVYYLHNPETQLGEVPRPDFLNRVRQAFEFLESAVAAGKIKFYGMAAWNGFRQEAKAADSLFFKEVEESGPRPSGSAEPLLLVPLYYQLAMTEALTLGNQSIKGQTRTMMEAAGDLGITLVASAALLQGQLSQNLPAFVAEALGLHSDLERALQFARSSPGITTALVGMSRAAPVEAEAKLVGVEPG